MKYSISKTMLVLFCATLFYSFKLQAQWARWAASGSNDQLAVDVAVDLDGDSYVVGSFKGANVNLGHDPGPPTFIPMANSDVSGNTEDGYLVKIDKTGAPLWAVRIGSSGNNDRCNAVATIRNTVGGHYIYVVGWFSGTATFQTTSGSPIMLAASGGQDAFIAKYDQNGVLIWAYLIGSVGTATADFAYDVAVDNSSGDRLVYVVGRNSASNNLRLHGFSGFISPLAGQGSDDGFLAQYADGLTTAMPTWVRFMSASGADAYYSVAADNNRVSAGGQFKTTGANITALLQINGTNATTPLNSVGGVPGTDVVIAHYDGSGNYIWAQNRGTAGNVQENATCVALDENNDTYAGGFVDGGAGGWIAFVTKVSSVGTTLWTSTGNSVGSGNDYVSSIALDKCGQHLFVGGLFFGTVFNFGTSSVNGYTGIDNDNFLISLDRVTGADIVPSLQRMGGNGNDVTYGIAADHADRVYVVGITTTASWNYATSFNLMPNGGGLDGFIWRYNRSTWPADGSIAAGDQARHQGISAAGCNLYASGHFFGNATYGATNLNSTNFGANPTKDIYLTQCTNFGTYTAFNKVAYGTANESATDQVMDAAQTAIYISGNVDAVSAGNSVVTNGTAILTARPHGLLVKTDLTGTPIWTRFAMANSATSYAYVWGVTYDNVNNVVYVCGEFGGSVSFSDGFLGTILTANGPNDAFIAKFGASGNLMGAWDVAYSTTGGTAGARDIYFHNNELYITGDYNGAVICPGTPNVNLPNNGGKAFAARYDVNGGALQALGHPTYNRAGKIVAAGIIKDAYITANNPATSNPVITRCSLGGSPFWGWSTPGTAISMLGLTTDNTYAYVTGGTAAAGSPNLSFPLSNNQYYMGKVLLSGGSVVCAESRPNQPGSVYTGYAIAQDPVTQNFYVAGSGVSPSEYGSIQEFLQNNCDYSHRTGDATAIVPGAAFSDLSQLRLYPNPTSGNITLRSETRFNNITVEVYDMLGKILYHRSFVSPNDQEIQLGHLPAGVYGLHVYNQEGLNETHKLIRE